MQEPNMAAIRQLELERTQQSGARWFYWIAALSLVNSAMNMNGGSINFAIGLSATKYVDGLAVLIAQSHADAAVVSKAVALGLDIVIAAIFFMFGKFASAKQSWAFILGMICYGADGLLAIPFADWLGLGFHGFALWCIYGGMQANKQLESLRPAPAVETPPRS